MDLPTIHQQLTDGVDPVPGYDATSRLVQTSGDLQEVLGALSAKLGELAEIWEAPSTELGMNAISRVKGHVDMLTEQAKALGGMFSTYLDQAGTAKAQVPAPSPLDEVVKSPTPAQALALGPVLPVLEADLQQRTGEARQLMQELTATAHAVDSATPGFEPLPSEVTHPAPSEHSGSPRHSMVSGQQVTSVPMAAGTDPSMTGTSSAAPTAGHASASPAQSTVPVQANVFFTTTAATALPGSVGTDAGRGTTPGTPSPAGGSVPPGGVSAGPGRGAGDGGAGHPRSRGGGQGPGGNTGGPGRGGSVVPGKGPVAGRNAAARTATTGGPLGSAGSRRGDDEDCEHQRPAYLHADETADDLFGTNEKTAPPVIGAPGQHH